jgi:hydrogenase maturation protease
VGQLSRPQPQFFERLFLKKTILIGWGNPDRQDDGVAWHVLVEVARRLELPAPVSYEEPFECGHPRVEFLFLLQLTPELAEEVAQYERAVFIDASVGGEGEIVEGRAVGEDSHLPVLSHHLTAEALMVLARSLYGAKAETLLLTVRGTQFQFERELSPGVKAAVPRAAEKILAWMSTE